MKSGESLPPHIHAAIEAAGVAFDGIVGQGGAGLVVRGIDRADQTPVAIKILRSNEPALLESFQREFRALARLSHPTLVPIRRFGISDGEVFFFVMDWIAGQPLHPALLRDESGRLDEDRLAHLIIAICDGLDYLHGQEWVHGDLKPSNILVSLPDGAPPTVHLLDLGLARHRGSEASTLGGTVEYLAPEVIRTRRYGPGADLYALGCTLIEALTGSPPFSGEDPLTVMRSHLHEPASIPEDGLSADLRDILGHLLDKDPERRYRAPWQVARDIAKSRGWAEVSLHGDAPHGVAISLPWISLSDRDAWLEATVATCLEGTHVALIEGDPGLGKSTLLSMLGAELQIHGLTVHRLQGRDTGPFRCVLDLLATLPAPHEEQRAARALIASRFPGIFPETSDQTPPPLDEEGERLRLFEAAATLLRTSSSVVLCVDDADEADPLSRDFLGFLPGVALLDESRRFSVIQTLRRTDGVEEFEDLPSSLSRITLSPLSQVQLGSALEAALGTRVSPSFLHVCQRHTGGNIGGLRDLLVFCAEEGILERSPEGWVVHERDNLAQFLPKTAQDHVRRQAARLDPSLLSLLSLVLAVPRPVPVEALATAADRDPDELRQGLSALVRADLLRWDGDLITAPAATRQLDGMALADPTLFHSRLAEWIRLHRPHDLDALAWHLERGPDPASALPLLRRAAEEALAQFDANAAESLLLRALALARTQENVDDQFAILSAAREAAEQLGHADLQTEHLEEMLLLAAGRNDPALLCQVFTAQCEAFQSTGEFDRSRRSADKALAFARQTGDRAAEARALRLIGVSLSRLKPGPEVLPWYEQALAIFEAEGMDAERGAILLDLGLARLSFLEDPAGALDSFQAAYEVFSTRGDKRGMARALGNAGRQLYALGRITEAQDHYLRAIALFDEMGDRRALALGYNSLGQAEITLCRYVDAISHLRQGLRIAREVRNLYAEEMIRENLGELYTMLGDYEQARASYEEARALARATGNAIGEITNDIDLAGVLCETREISAALALLREAGARLEQARDDHVACWLQYRFGMVYLVRGDQYDPRKALEHFQAMGVLADQLDSVSYRILSRSYAAAAMVQLGRIPEALALSTQAIALLDQQGELHGGIQDILLNHARVLRASRKLPEAGTFIDRAHAEVQRIASTLTDVHLYKSFTEQVRIHQDIQKEHALLHRGDSLHTVNAIRERNLLTLYEVSRKINSTLDLPLLLETIMDSALDALHAERGLLFLLEGEHLVLKASRNVEHETIHDATEISLSILKDVVRQGKPVIVSDTAKEEAYRNRESVVTYNIRSLICMPMRSRDRIIGTVYVDVRSDAMQAIAFSEIDADFLDAFANLATLAIENARLHEGLRQENLHLRREVESRFGFENIIGASAPMDKLFHETQFAIQSEGNVLIYGESGTGKELIARAIHYNGPRKNGHFVAVDCGAMPDTLLESELFGYKRGAFTGAYADKRGLFEEAHLGTLFLDEIANTSLAFQARLLRVLQEGEFRRVGDSVSRRVDVRIICATNTLLPEEIAAGRFRQDLFYRLNVIPISIPPLRQRTADIPLLVHHFIDQFNTKNHRAYEGITEECLALLQNWTWPGNVRELENLINRVLVQSPDPIISSRHLPTEFRSAVAPSLPTEPSLDVQMQGRRLASLQEVEKEHILYVLRHTKNKTEAAKVLGLKRTTLVEKMKKLGMM